MNKKQKNKIRSLKDKNRGFIELLRKRDKRIKALEYETEATAGAVRYLEEVYCAYLVSLCKKRGGVLRFKRHDVNAIMQKYIIRTRHDDEFIYIELEERETEEKNS